MGTPCSDVVATATDFRLFNTSHTAQRGTQDSGMSASSGLRGFVIVADPRATRLAARCPIPPRAGACQLSARPDERAGRLTVVVLLAHE